MSRSMRALMREAGSAFAVLSIYVLMLLTPLHQAAASQRGFAELGYETAGVWSICTAINAAQDETETPTAVKCPVTGIGKQDLAQAATPSGPVVVQTIVSGVVYKQFAQAPPSSPAFPHALTRAPPALV